MTKTQQLAALAGLVVVMVAVYAHGLSPSRRAARPPEQHEPPAVAPPSSPSSEPDLSVSAARHMQRERAQQLTWKRDPFTRGAASDSLGGLTLSGILWDENRAMAIINGQTVMVGEEFEGYRIVGITQDHVDISDGSQTFRLSTTP